MLTIENSILQKIHFPMEEGESFAFDIKRDDLIDPVVSGNKWRKLEYNVLHAKEMGSPGVITFGGAFSNHLVATAKACQLIGLHAVGIVRGDELNKDSNATLRACAEYGMELVFITREEYRGQCDSNYLNEVKKKYPTHLLIPEGGRNYHGMVGCQHILGETENDYDYVYLAAGTGTTAAGVLMSSSEETIVRPVSALKGDFLQKDIYDLIYKALFDEEMVEEFMTRLEMINDGHFGGYGKVNNDLLDFLNEVYAKIELPLDPIYTGKAFYRMIEDVKAGRIAKDSKVLFIHTGGIQGAASWKDILTYL